MTRKLRVLEMIDAPTLGGGQVHLLTLARHLDKSLFDASIAASGGGPLEEEARAAGLPFVPLPIRKKPSRKDTRAIADALRERGVDVLHTHGGVAGLAGRRAAAKAGTPVVVHTLHGIHYLHYRNPFLKYLLVFAERRLARRTDAVIFVSRADYDRGTRLRLAPQPKMRLIRNGVEPPVDEGPAGERRREALRAALELAGPVVGAVSRLHRQKGVIHLLRAAPEILRRRPEARIVVAGGGPLEDAARAAGLPFVPVPVRKSLSGWPAREIAAILRGRGIDILHTHGGVAGLAGRRAAALAGTPVVVHTLHGIHYLHYRNPVLR
jgi:glycosyltransferase involved in cell wall biosynthesis